MKEEVFRQALREHSVPILILDPKWHRLFAIHGKTERISEIEKKLSRYLAEQGRVNQELKDLKHLKNNLLDSIRRNMDGANEENEDRLKTRKLEENSRLVDEINQKMERYEDRLLELPHIIRDTNEALMLASMEYCYDKMRVNERETEEISEWIQGIRVELKKNIIKKQNREWNNREIYGFMHDIFGMQILDLFDIVYEDEDEDEENTTQEE